MKRSSGSDMYECKQVVDDVEAKNKFTDTIVLNLRRRAKQLSLA